MIKKNFRPVFALGGNTSSAGLTRRRQMFAGGSADIDTTLAKPGGPSIRKLYSRYDDPKAAGINFDGLASDANDMMTKVSPYISNIANSFRTAPMPKVPGMVNPVTLSRISLDAARQKASSSARSQDLAADRSLDEQSAAAVRSSNLARNLEAQGQISEQEAFLNARQKAEAAGMNLNVDAMNTGAMNKYNDEMTGRNIAIQRNQSENLSNAVDKNIAIRNEAAKGKLDLQKLQTLSSIWKESGVYDRMMKRMKGEGNTDPTGVMGQMKWLGDAIEETKAYGGKMAFGGVKGTVAKGYLNPFGNTRSIGLGPGIEKSKFNPSHIRHTQHNLLALGGDPSEPVIYSPGSKQMASNQAGYQNDSRFRDMINFGVQGGVNPMDGEDAKWLHKFANQTFADPANRSVVDAVSVFNQRPDLAGMNPQQRLDTFYSMNSSNPSVQRYRELGKSAGYGPLGVSVNEYNPGASAQEFKGVNSAPAVTPTYGIAETAVRNQQRQAGTQFAMGGLNSAVVDHSMWREPYKENALTNNDPNLYAMGGPGLYATNKTAFVDSTLNANKNLDWVKRLYEKNTPSLQIPGEEGRSTHFMADNGKGYVFPTVVRQDGALKYLGGEDQGMEYAKKTGTGIQFKTPEQGSWFAANGYKTGTGVRVGHTPMAMGGEFSGETTSSDLERWNHKWRDAPSVGMDIMKDGGWISKAVNPAHKGFCTPMTKATCTPRRKAFAQTMKKNHGFH